MSNNTNVTEKIKLFLVQFKIPLIILLIALCVGIVLVWSAARSIPGESLYSVKTNVIENAIGMIKVSRKDKANYQVTLMQNRVEEVKELIQQPEVSPKAIAQLDAQISKHFNSFSKNVEESIDSAFPKTEVLTTANEFASVARAIELLCENDSKLTAYGETVETTRNNAVNLYKDRVDLFVQTETEQVVLAYIQTFLTEVKNELSAEGTSAEVIDDAQNYLDRVILAIKDKKYAKAVTSIGEAYRFIRAEKYTGIIQILPTTNTPIATTSPQTATTTNTATGTPRE